MLLFDATLQLRELVNGRLLLLDTTFQLRKVLLIIFDCLLLAGGRGFELSDLCSCRLKLSLEVIEVSVWVPSCAVVSSSRSPPRSAASDPPARGLHGVLKDEASPDPRTPRHHQASS